MTQVNAWQDAYLISKTATIDTAATFGNASGEIGLATNKFGLYLDSHPNIDPGQAFVDQVKTSGLSTRLGRRGSGDTVVVEWRPSIKSPLASLPMHATPKALGLILWLLFQENVVESGTTPFAKTYLPPTTTAFEAYCSIARRSGNAAKSEVIHGCVVNHINLSGGQGDAMTLTADFIGKTYSNALNLSAVTVAGTFSDEAPLMFQDCTVTLGGTAININSMSLDLNAGLIPKHHNAQTVTKYVMGMFTGSGTINFPMSNATVGDFAQRDAFIAGTPTTLKWSWGSPGVLGNVVFEMNIRYSGDPISGDDELVQDLAFDILYDAPQTIDEAIKVTVADAVDRAI